MPLKDPIKLAAYAKEHGLIYRADPIVKEIRKQYNRTYYYDNRTFLIAQTVERERNYLKNNVDIRIKKNLRRRLNLAIKNEWKSGSAIIDLGCSIQHLKVHFELFWDEGMSWENYGEWVIDHIRPLDSFDLANRTQFLEAVNYKNLQPLWWQDNREKSFHEAKYQ